MAVACERVYWLLNKTRSALASVYRCRRLAFGLSEWTVLLKHALRGGIIPVVSFTGPALAALLAGTVVVERVFALPGAHLWLLRDDNGTEDDILSPREAACLRALQIAGKLSGRRVLSLTVPPEECFVLGDNSNVSVDSRDFGPVPIDAILGRALL